MGSFVYCKIFGFSNNISILSRSFHSSGSQLAIKIPLSKQVKVFNKLMSGSSKKKRKFIFDDLQTPSSDSKLKLGQHIKYNKENSRRIKVLNTVFMKHISDLLVTKDMGADVLSKGLELSRISMTPDFHQLNVYWGCHSEKNIAELETILPDIGYTLRHELSQLKVVGIVPRIVFIKDKYFSEGAKIDYLLSIADFGDDHVPRELESDFKTDSSTITEKTKSASDEKTPVDNLDLEEESMPPMRQDVFNLDHQLIMNKILKKLQRSKAIHRFEPNLMIKCDGSSVPSISPEVMTKEERKLALAKFVLNRRILQEKSLKNKHKCDGPKEYVSIDPNEEIEDDDWEEKDYIEDDFVEGKNN